MGTIFKREFKSLMSHAITYIFLALTVFVFGFFLVFFNLASGDLQIEIGPVYSLWALAISIPFLCMFSYSRDRTNNRLKFLFSLPLKTTDIVFGKYFAYLCVLAIPTLIISIIPAVLSSFGSVIYASSYASILFYFLTGAAFIAICMFINLRVRHELVTLVFGTILLAFLIFCPSVADKLPKTPAASLTAILVLEVFVCILIYAGSGKKTVGLISLALSIIPTVVCFFIFKSDFSTLFLRICTFISPVTRFEYFSHGLVRLEDAIYLLSVTAPFLLFTQLTVNKEKNGDVKITKLDDQQTKDKYRSIFAKAARTAAISLALILLCNALAVLLPASLTVADASGCEKYSISESSKEFAENISHNVTIYLLCEDGIADASVEAVMEKYASENPKISCKKIDVTSHPEFTSDYIGMSYTDTSGGVQPISNNSVIIESEIRSTVLDWSSFYHYRIGSSSYTYKEFLSYSEEYAKRYGSIPPSGSYKEFSDLDKVFASALEYVTLPEIGAVMTLEGHGEKPLPLEFYNSLGYSNIPCERISLSDRDAVPENCTTLIISSPETDISSDDADKIISFFEGGGEILLVTSPENADMKNLMSVAENCGLTALGGVIEENKEGAYLDEDNRTQILFDSGLGDMMISNAHPIKETDTLPAGISISEMLTTSTQASLVGSTGRNTYNISLTAEKSTADGDTAHLFWISSYDAFTEKAVESYPANTSFLLYSVSYMGGNNTFTPSLSVEARNISKTDVQIQPAVNYIFFGVLTAVSVIMLGMGISLHICRKLRKK